MGGLLEIEGLSCGYGGRALLSDLTFSVRPAEMLVILGRNGVGKTTLFKTLLGYLTSLAGSVRIDGHENTSLNRRAFAQLVGYIPQEHSLAFAFRVIDFVLMGRTPEMSTFGVPSDTDRKIAGEALERLGIARLAQEPYSTLSGGERQMVLVARALAQHPRLLLMDEPCSSLDYGNQVQLLEVVRNLAGDGLAVVMISHDPNHALMLNDQVLCLYGQDAYTLGKAAEVLTAAELERLYGVQVALANARTPDGRACTACVPLLKDIPAASQAGRAMCEDKGEQDDATER